MGRASQTSNPAEINGSWIPAGEDAAGWVWTQQQYDWKGRPTVTILPSTDGGQSSPTREITYGGCGCAGGEVVTLRDEIGRRQRVTSDVLGRNIKTEVLNWDQSAYSTTINSYNARDQVTNSRQYQGTQSSGVFQEGLMTYDGHGRLLTSKAPEQTSPTSYTYYVDDTTNVVTDARGASQTFIYNQRHQVTGVSHTAPPGIPVPSPVSFTYDGAGNRTQMTDGTGSITYSYNQLSQLTTETRQFTGLTGSYPLSYEYTLSGQLKALTDHTGSRVDYSYDQTGRLTSVSGSGAASVPSYASNLRYRAWGAVKDISYGNGVQHHLDFNSRLRNTGASLSNLYGGSTMAWSYAYYADGQVMQASDTSSPIFDRKYEYDHAGRLAQALTGTEARGGTTPDGPYRQTYTYDVWENVVGRSSRLWNQTTTEGVSYTNNRRQGWQYDFEGRVTMQADGTKYGYDAAGRQTTYASGEGVGGGSHPQQPALEIAHEMDGNGKPVRRVQTQRWDEFIYGEPGELPIHNVHESASTVYYLRSSVMGHQVVAELDSTGYKRGGHIYAEGMEVAKQEIYNPGSGSRVLWRQTSPVTGSSLTLLSDATVGRAEIDPLGADVTTPPEPEEVIEPSFLNPLLPNFWPLEYTGGQTGELELGMSEYEARLEFTRSNIRDAHAAQAAWRRRDLGTAQQILASNPNVGIQVRANGSIGASIAGQMGFGFSGTLNFTLWGSQAAEFLYGVGQQQDSLRFSSATIYEQQGDIDNSLRRIIFDISLKNSHVDEICGEDRDRKTFNATINLTLPDNATGLIPEQPIDRKTGFKSEGSTVTRMGSEGDPNNSNYNVGKLRFENVNITSTSKTAQLIVPLYRRGFSSGTANNSLSIRIVGTTRDGGKFRRSMNLTVNCP